jgi:hypothetical protein
MKPFSMPISMHQMLPVMLACAFAGCSHQTEHAAPTLQKPVPIAILPVCAAGQACEGACASGDASACELWGNTIAMNDAHNDRRAEALSVYEKACAGGKAMACVQAGRLIEYPGTAASAAASEPPAAPDFARAYALYQQACAQMETTGCYNAAYLLEAGKGVPRDEGKARELFTIVCKAGSQSACARAND